MIRSLLYVPASSERFVDRAHERGADAIVLDLEDGVAPSEKARARTRLPTTVPAVGRSGAVVLVRINMQPESMLIDAEWACCAGACGLWIPKVESAAQINRIVRHLEAVELSIGRERNMFLVPAVETAAAVFEARALAASSPRILGMNAGSEDLATSMGGEPISDVLRVPKLLVHLAAKAAGVLSFGLLRSVADYKDLAGVADAAREARLFGFDGATCVHPSAVPILNAAFSPGDEELARAQQLVAAAEAADAQGLGAVVFDGKMVDAPVVARARRLLEKGPGARRANCGSNRSRDT